MRLNQLYNDHAQNESRKKKAAADKAADELSMHKTVGHGHKMGVSEANVLTTLLRG